MTRVASMGRRSWRRRWGSPEARSPLSILAEAVTVCCAGSSSTQGAQGNDQHREIRERVTSSSAGPRLPKRRALVRCTMACLAVLAVLARPTTSIRTFGSRARWRRRSPSRAAPTRPRPPASSPARGEIWRRTKTPEVLGHLHDHAVASRTRACDRNRSRTSQRPPTRASRSCLVVRDVVPRVHVVAADGSLLRRTEAATRRSTRARSRSRP